jgi:hypothetical protein
MAIIGYARVSTTDQDPQLQLGGGFVGISTVLSAAADVTGRTRPRRRRCRTRPWPALRRRSRLVG